MNPFFVTDFSISDSLKTVRKSVLIYETIINCRKGNRPSFTDAGNPELANRLYEYIITECRKQITNVQTGIFGADMKISLTNDGPFTIILDSDDLA